MLLHKNNKVVKEENGLSYFRNEVNKSEHSFRQANVRTIESHLLREHKVLERANNTYTFKGKTFQPAATVLQGIKTVINFHTAYLLGNPVTITGTPKAVEIMNRYYRKGIYSKVDWKILNELLTFGNAFEYVYFDSENKTIKSKVFRNRDSYPIYDENMEYKYFVEHWKSNQERDEHFVVYTPEKILTYVNGILKDEKTNFSGLPIHYSSMDRSKFDQFGESMVNDLIPIQDKIEYLISKLDDGITTLSLNPVAVCVGARITQTEMVNSDIAGAVVNLEEGGNFFYANAEMDYNCIKYEFDQLYQQFNLIAAIPGTMLGQSNIANVSENSMSMIYQLTENKGKQNINSLIDGYRLRWEYMRKLMKLNHEKFSDKDFDSLNVSFNVSKPTDTKMNMENMKIQQEMGAISKRTILELSPYTTDSAQELQRLADEGCNVVGNDNNKNFTPDDKE